MTFGNRRYRVRGLGKNTSLDVLRVNMLVTNGTACSWIPSISTRLGTARHSSRRLPRTSRRGRPIKKDLGRVLLKLEDLQDAIAAG